MRIATLIVTALAVPMLAGCGIGESLTDPCLDLRGQYEMASRKVSGLRDRKVARTHPAHRLADENLGRARRALAECEAAYGS